MATEVLASREGQPIHTNKIHYDKSVAVIYNPASGKKKDIRELIQNQLSSHDIKCEFYGTKSPMDGWKIAQHDLDLDKFSALIAVGGDGTLHEVLNGLLHRKDKKRIPIGLVPNGSGNDLCLSAGIESL